MSIGSTIRRILGGSAAKAVAAFALNEFDQAVAAAKKTEIGKAVADAIHAAEQPGLTGAAKLEQAIAAVVPTVLLYVAGDHLAPTRADAETFARAVIESTLADIKRTGAAAIASAVLRMVARV